MTGAAPGEKGITGNASAIVGPATDDPPYDSVKDQDRGPVFARRRGNWLYECADLRAPAACARRLPLGLAGTLRYRID